MTWAYSDESERAATMYFGVLLVEPSTAVAAREQLRSMLLPGQRRVHTKKESPRRRRQFLDVVAALEARTVVLELRRSTGTSRIAGREALLAAGSDLVRECSVASWVLDHQEPAQAHRDRQVIDAVMRRSEHELVYDHKFSYEEPLLWAVDAIVWAVGTGGEARRRAGQNIEVVRVRP